MDQWARRRRAVSWCASEPVPAAYWLTQTGWPGKLVEEGSSVAVALRTCPCAPPPRPCPSSLSSRGVVLVLGQGHRDAMPLVLQPRAQASFPSTAGRAPHRRRVRQPWRPLETKATEPTHWCGQLFNLRALLVVVVVLTMCSTRVSLHPSRQLQLIMGTVSMWTRPPALHLCAGPKKIYPSSQLSRPTAGTCRCGTTATSTNVDELHAGHRPLGDLSLHTTGFCNDQVQNSTSCKCGSSTLSPRTTETQRTYWTSTTNIKHPCQCTASWTISMVN